LCVRLSKSGRIEPPQLFMLSMEGGEAFQFTTLARGAGNPQWSPDGKSIAFGNGATAEELAKAAPRPESRSRRESGASVTA
jgi:Tol biopolymer transport system component